MRKVLFIVAVIAGVGAYWFFGQGGGALNTGGATDPSGTVAGFDATEYADTNYHFRILYPKNLEVRVYEEDEGARTITFEDPNTGEGFQIFVVPYNETHITPERFAIDAPAGVMQDPQDITVDAVPAKIFFGYQEQMGDTREVWFIKKGFLYEVTTYKALDSLLSNIMQTWQFI